jgi:sugar lactone lactonase YvrE
MVGLLLAGLMAGGCAVTGPAAAGVRLHEVGRLSGFQVPECVLVEPATGGYCVSNIDADAEHYWADDGIARITRVAADGQRAERWLDSTPAAPLNSPKGMCLLGGRLFIADNTRLLSCDAASGGGLTVVATGFVNANDLATDGRSIWLSDSAEGGGQVWCISPDGAARREIPAPSRVNGLTFYRSRLFAVSWDLHEVYELDPEGQFAPRPFGLARHFTNLDGIEVLDDGTFIVSDFVGNQLCAISPDRQEVSVLARVSGPADIGIDRRRGLLYAPLFTQNEVVVFSIVR